MAHCEICDDWCPDERKDEFGVAWCWQCDNEHHMATYKGYLQSEEWASVRRLKLSEVNFTCERCGLFPGMSKQKLEVHHKNYHRLGREEMSDLEVLCAKCHKKEHGR